ncbi:Cnl2/NKP2 family protein-domain-containing protein [Microdochium trichocladiopsis]|uniref:Cnl2/NKP2 family protein-domain-containing protein n=1 Tax=Microdochium trichocladiopsis TaxID=1682393 RepID=A0A9P9BVP5_9PEZI|nr:Cnl2/NKP2 family protein-domain-containing protein [Microdochium trichocladiopsis]KAH7039957.1 Cnl2/NKP2 family protein-domain-containing protein [Microdochium trichocladiopsis]
MAPTEASILENYLLLPARLPSIISLQEFTALFPKTQQSSPHIRSLYRDLQQQRNAAVDEVADNIDAEARGVSRSLRRELVRARLEAEHEERDDEIEIERALFGPTSNLVSAKPHHLMTILPEMEAAVADMEAEIKKLEEDEAALLKSVKQTVGSLSDLRYGRLGNTKLRTESLEALRTMQDVCTRGT